MTKFFVLFRTQEASKDGGHYSVIERSFYCKDGVRALELAEKHWKKNYEITDLNLLSVALCEKSFSELGGFVGA
jgi:hypothetical protein